MSGTALVDVDRWRRHAGTLLLITTVLWLHEWLVALLVIGWVAWLFLHEALEGRLGATIVRLWRRAWPPSALALLPLLAANALLYWLYVPIPGKVLPIALNLLGFSMVLGGWCAGLVHRGWRQHVPVSPAEAPEPLAREP